MRQKLIVLFALVMGLVGVGIAPSAAQASVKESVQETVDLSEQASMDLSSLAVVSLSAPAGVDAVTGVELSPVTTVKTATGYIYTRFAQAYLQVNGSNCTTGKATLYVTWEDNGAGVAIAQMSLANNTGRSITKDDAWATRGSTKLEHYPRYNGLSFDNGTILDGIQTDFDPRYFHGYPSYGAVQAHATTRTGCGRAWAVSSI